MTFRDGNVMKRKYFPGFGYVDYDEDMNWKIHAALIWGFGLYLALMSEAGQAAPVSGCGQDVGMRDVMVLDLEPFGRDPETTEEYLLEYAGQYRLLNARIEEIFMRSRPAKDPHAMFRRAQKLGEKRGCDLVLILKTGPYLGKQRGWRMKRVKDHGYAFVVVGERLAYE